METSAADSTTMIHVPPLPAGYWSSPPVSSLVTAQTAANTSTPNPSPSPSITTWTAPVQHWWQLQPTNLAFSFMKAARHTPGRRPSTIGGVTHSSPKRANR